MQFWHYFAIRLTQAFFVVFLVVTIVFFVSRLVGDPVATMLPMESRVAADVEQLKETLGLNDPLFVQYGNFLWDLAQGDLGTSFRGGGKSAIDAIGDRALNTFKLGAAGMVFAIALGAPLGLVAALRRGAGHRLAGARPGGDRAGHAELLAGPDDDLLLRRAAGLVPDRRRAGRLPVLDPAGGGAGACWRWPRSCG